VAEPSYAKENLPPTPASSVTPSRHEVVDLTSPQPVPSKVQPLPPKPTGPSHQQHMESMAAAKALSRAAALGHCDLPTSASPISRPNFRISSAAAKDGPIMLDSHGQVTADPSKARSYIARPHQRFKQARPSRLSHPEFTPLSTHHRRLIFHSAANSHHPSTRHHLPTSPLVVKTRPLHSPCFLPLIRRVGMWEHSLQKHQRQRRLPRLQR
jgi:hypothetical protein